jgi:tetratricopeptide (TPR) repeat protein
MQHPDRETLERYLSGTLPDGASHLLRRHLFLCPACEERLVALVPSSAPPDDDYRGAIRRLLTCQRVEAAAIRQRLARERAAAPALWREVASQSREGRRPGVLAEPRFHTWGFCEFLIDRAYRTIQEDVLQAEEILRLAVDAAGRLSPGEYGSGATEAIQARAWSWLANIRRVRGDFQEAEAAFQTAELHLSRSWLDPLDEGLLLEARSALCRAQSHFDEALELIGEAVAIYREVNEPSLQGRALSSQGLTLQYRGRYEAAADCFRTSLFLIDGLREPRLLVGSQYNLINCLQDSGRSAEAAELIPEARRLIEQMGGRSDLLRLRWAEGRIAVFQGRLAAAEKVFREVRDTFLADSLAFDAALASLDLATVYLRQRRTEETKRLAAEMIPVFQAREVCREALAALIVFQQAAELEQLTTGLVEEIAGYLRQARGNPGLRFREDEGGE